MKQIPVTKGQVALVDDDMFPFLSQFKWHDMNGYAVKRVGNDKCFMHHFVVGRPLNGLVVDHIDGNKLNNQRANLRIVTSRVNNWRLHNRLNNTKPLGVYWNKRGNNWKVEIVIKQKHHYLGTFASQDEAGQVYLNCIKLLEEYKII